jgi:hypothetical protein
LPGFFIDAAPEFERWLDDERNRFRRAACQAAWELAESAEQCGQLSLPRPDGRVVYAARATWPSRRSYSCGLT